MRSWPCDLPPVPPLLPLQPFLCRRSPLRCSCFVDPFCDGVDVIVVVMIEFVIVVVAVVGFIANRRVASACPEDLWRCLSRPVCVPDSSPASFLWNTRAYFLSCLDGMLVHCLFFSKLTRAFLSQSLRVWRS